MTNKERFIDDYVKEASIMLDITDSDKLAKIRDIANERYMGTNLKIFNSDKFKEILIDSSDFWYGRSNFILNENGVLMDTTKRNKSIMAGILNQDIDIRQLFKKKKKDAVAANDSIAEKKHSNFEALTKLMINGLYGLSGYSGSSVMNIDVSDTCTTGGRNIIAVSALTIESLYGWFHFYEFSAHMKLINRVVNSDCDELCKRFTLELKSTDEIAKVMLGEYYDNYYRISSLKTRINKMTDNQKRVLYVKNNIKAFYAIPEVKSLLGKIITAVLPDNMCQPLDNGGVLMSPFAHPAVKDDIQTLMQWTRDLAFGMCYYEGDYYDREYQETMVDIVTAMRRRKIGNMDTDSAVSTMYHDKLIMLETYKDIIGKKAEDFVFTEGTIPMILMTIYLAAVKQALQEYATSINIDPNLIHMIDLECEIVMEQEHLSISKKNYAFTTVVKDFLLKLGKMDSRGFKFKKSDANGALAEQVENDIHNMIMCNVHSLDFGKLVKHVHNITTETIKMIKTDDFIINKKSLVKVSDADDINWGDSRMKAVRLWDALFPQEKVEIPGSFGMVRISLTDEILEDYKYNKPDVYKVLYNHAKELYEFGMQNRVIKKVAKIMDKEDEDNDMLVREIRDTFNDNCRSVLVKICKLCRHKDDTKENPGTYKDITNLIYNSGLSDSEARSIEKFFKLPVNTFRPEKDITSAIDRIAVPIDINSVPELFKEHNYRLLDIEASSEYEHLLGPLLNTTSVSVIKNKSKNMVVTSVLQVF